MFEIYDERIGKIKLVNVTEARANFAEILKVPTDLKVVITRHGKPLKVMVDYEELVRLLEEKSSSQEKNQAAA